MLFGNRPSYVAPGPGRCWRTRTVSAESLRTLVLRHLEGLEGPNGEELFDLPGALFPDEDTPAPSG